MEYALVEKLNYRCITEDINILGTSPIPDRMANQIDEKLLEDIGISEVSEFLKLGGITKTVDLLKLPDLVLVPLPSHILEKHKKWRDNLSLEDLLKYADLSRCLDELKAVGVTTAEQFRHMTMAQITLYPI